MWGSGFIKQANTVLKENRDLRKKKSMFKKERTFLNLTPEEARIREFKTTDKHASRSLLSQIQMNEKEQRRKEVLAIAWGIGLLMIVILLIGDSFYTYENTHPEVVSINKAEEIEKLHQRKEKYSYLMSSGDEWFDQKKYYNAAFQYRLALDVFPEDILAMQKLFAAYDLNCKTDGKNCDQLEKLVEKEKRK